MIWIELLKQLPIFVLPEPLVQYRIHKDSTSSNFCIRNLWCFHNEIYFILKKFFENMPEHLFVEGFGNHFIKKGTLTKEELLCEQAFLFIKSKIGPQKFIYHQIGMEKLHELLNNQKTRQVLETSYNFTNKSYYRLSNDVPALKEYEHKAYCFEHLLANEKIEKSNCVAIYGTGNYACEIFNYFLKNDNFNAKKIKYFIENNNKKIGTCFCGRTIVSLEDAINKNNVDVIIIGSYNYQDVIFDRIKTQFNNVTIIKVF